MSYGKVKDTFWTDERGRRFGVPGPGKRLRPHANSVHAALRAFVFRRDGFCCVRCGWESPAPMPDYDGRSIPALTAERARSRWVTIPTLNYLEVDHVQPRSRGGSNHPDNLQSLCRRCNSGKCDRPTRMAV